MVKKIILKVFGKYADILSNSNEIEERKMLNILRAHGMVFEIINGRILVNEYYTKDCVPGVDIVDVTDWTKKALLGWLGY